jgi:hypothetical protein
MDSGTINDTPGLRRLRVVVYICDEVRVKGLADATHIIAPLSGDGHDTPT